MKSFYPTSLNYVVRLGLLEEASKRQKFILTILFISITHATSVFAADVTINSGTTVTTTQYIDANSTLTNNGAIFVVEANPGEIQGTGVGTNNGSGSFLINNGSITGGQQGVDSSNATNLTITNNANGVITGSEFAGVFSNYLPLGTLTNYGVITGSSIYGAGIVMYNGLTTFNNAQGGNSATAAQTAVTYNGILPTNYNIIINSPTYYGQLVGNANTEPISGAMTYGIYAGSIIAPGASTYASVLSGLTSSNILNYNTTYFYGNAFEQTLALTPQAGSSTIWDLTVTSTDNLNLSVVTSLNSPFNSSTARSNVILDGGTYQIASSGSESNSLYITSNSGTIDQNGASVTFTNPIGDATSRAQGSLTVANSSSGGSVTLSAYNTYTGATTINSGATLALSGAGSIAQSSGVSNNGTFNTTGSAANVSVASYTQSSTGTLAMNVSPTDTQQLIVTGAASLAGGLSLTGSAGTYSSGRYALLTAGSVSGTFGSLSSNLSSLTTLGYSLSYDASNVYLIFTPNVADTQQSLVNTASALQNTYTLQNSVLANSFSYDCNVFGANNVCVSAGGRNTAVSAANGLNNTSGLLIAAYRPHPNYRVGAYADQNLSVSNPGGTVNLGNNTPLLGLFGAWNERLDGTGAEIKVSAAYGQKNTTITRSVVGTSEAGTGSSQLNSQGAQVTAKYGFTVTPAVIVSPYIGVRYTQNNMGGYTEGTSSTVTAPLTYSALNTNATTALAGLGASYRVIPAVITFASAGVETDTNTSNGTYSATGISGLTPINFNANPVKTRPTATLGAYYDIEKNQRLGITGIYRQEAYQAVSTTTVMATYTIGL
jgi:hypothetical protein